MFAFAMRRSASASVEPVELELAPVELELAAGLRLAPFFASAAAFPSGVYFFFVDEPHSRP